MVIKVEFSFGDDNDINRDYIATGKTDTVLVNLSTCRGSFQCFSDGV